jgi:hypothetical protein
MTNGDTLNAILEALGGSSGSLNTGAANVSSSQVSAAITATPLAIARPTRRQVTFKNTDGSITVYVGPATVTVLNGMELKAGQSITVTAVVAWQVISASGAPVICVTDEYD